MTSAAKLSFAAVEMPFLEAPSGAETSRAGETPSAVEMPAEEYASEEEPAATGVDVVDAEAAAEAPALQFESVDEAAQQEELDVPSVAARVAANPDWQALLTQLGV